MRRLWRLSGERYAKTFDGGYGLLFDGRWNTVGRPITYCSTSPSLCVLEKLVHIEDTALVPRLVMVRYEAPDDLVAEEWRLGDLPPDWHRDQPVTQAIGDGWLEAASTPLILVPSVIVPLGDSPDLNVLVNHRHPDAARIVIAAAEPFELDGRLIAV